MKVIKEININHSQVIERPENECEILIGYIRLLAKRRMLWLNQLWSNVDENKDSHIHHEINTYLTVEDLPSEERSWQANNPDIKILNTEIDSLENALLSAPHFRINKLIKLFKLDRQERAILFTCFAISLEPNLSRVFAYLNDHSARDYVNEELVARLFGFGRSLSLNQGSPILNWQLVHETANAKNNSPIWEIDRFVRSWILGNNGMDPDIRNIVTPVKTYLPLSNWPVQKYVTKIKKSLENGIKVRLVVSAEKGNGRKSFAAFICKAFNKKLYTLKSEESHPGQEQSLRKAIQRQLILDNALLCYQIENGDYASGHINHPHFQLSIFITSDLDISIPLSSNEVEEIVLLPSLLLYDRKKYLKNHIPEAKHWSKEFRNKLLHRQYLSIDQLNRLNYRSEITEEEIKQELNNFDLKGLHHLLQHISSNFTMNDLIVSAYVEDALNDFMFEAFERLALWELPAINRLFPYGKGLLGLFSGPPGTGKTMAAQVIANELGLDIYRINLANVVNKYVGESSKNLERILKKAQHNNAIIHIDEADALLGQRTEVNSANDRFANTETNYLLQAIEQYPGILILSTNKKENIDPGFFRRFRYNIVFPIPDAKTRSHLWQQLVKEMVGDKVQKMHNLQLKQLANLVELTGAQIKQSILSAIYLSRKEDKPLKMQHIVTGLERELMKDGRGLERKVKTTLMTIS